MKRLLLLLFLFFTSAIFAQPYFQKIFGDTLTNNIAKAVAQSASGSIYVAGNFNEFTTSAIGISLTKLDASGNILWTQVILQAVCSVNRMLLTNDQNLLMTGQITDSVGNMDAIAIKVDTAGAIVFNKSYGTNQTTEALQAMDETNDGGYIFSGFTTNLVGPGNAFYVVKTDDNGNLQWEQSYGFPVNSTSEAIKQTVDGGYVISGDKKTSGPDYNPYVIKIDSAGGVVWETNVNNVYNSGCKNLLINAEGFYIIIGESATAASAYFDPFIIKVDTGGTVVWSHSIPSTNNPDAGYDIIEPVPNNYLITGFSYDSIAASTQLVVMRLDSLGYEVTRRYYGGTGYDQGYDIIQAADHSGFLAAGSVTVGTEGKYFLIYDDLLGITTTVNQSNRHSNNFLKIFPDPSNGVFYLDVNFKSAQNLKAVVYNLTGEVIYQLEISKTAGELFPVNLSEIAGGYYLVRVSSDAETIVKSITIVK